MDIRDGIAGMRQPVLLALDRDRDILAAIERDLSRRFAADYRIVTTDTPEAALDELMLLIKWR